MANNYKTLTLTTGSIASGATYVTPSTGLHNYLDILKVKVSPNTAGVAFRVEIYKKDTLTSDIAYRSRQVPGGDVLIDPFDEETGDEREEGFITPYQDDDATGELHIKIYNYGPSSSTFTVTILYREVAMIAYVAADESKVNNTLASSAYLTLNVQASSKYKFRAHLFWTAGGGTPGIKVALGGTATVTSLKGQVTQIDDSGNAILTSGRFTALASAVGNDDTGDNLTIVEGVAEVNAAGTLLISWAQNTTDAGNATLLQRGSYLELTPIPS